ncbi:hypothetical protein V6N12_042825 [Hibiscus sabdariffa]|uniref:Uncharacterized protein n=1 Tax=Hibiscus sabdariffa TaxID=183260 RepID=A0ABR2AU43_9ROSI
MAFLGPTNLSICSRISSGILSNKAPSDYSGELEVELVRSETDSHTFLSSVAMAEHERSGEMAELKGRRERGGWHERKSISFSSACFKALSFPFCQV